MNLNTETIVAIGTAAASIAASVVSIVKAVSASKKAARLERLLEDAKSRETYLICPSCKRKILLSEVDFHLPSGAFDNNLNGKPDSDEL